MTGPSECSQHSKLPIPLQLADDSCKATALESNKPLTSSFWSRRLGQQTRTKEQHLRTSFCGEEKILLRSREGIKETFIEYMGGHLVARTGWCCSMQYPPQ